MIKKVHLIDTLNIFYNKFSHRMLLICLLDKTHTEKRNRSHRCKEISFLYQNANFLPVIVFWQFLLHIETWCFIIKLN